jgi:hypothetical protein
MPTVLFYPFTPGTAGPGGTADAEVGVMRRSGLVPVAAQLAVPVALGLLVGGVLAYQAGSSNNLVHPVPLGAVATPTPSFGKPGPTPTPTPTAPATATTTTTTSANGN